MKQVCRKCKRAQSLEEFPEPHTRWGRNAKRKHPADWCRTCRTTEGRAESNADEENETPTQQLDRLISKIKPTEAEWAIVQEAAGKIRELLQFKVNTGGEYAGKTAWDVIEEATGPDHRRFHQLCALTTVQYAIWVEESVRALKIHRTRFKPETIDTIISLWRAGNATASIAARLNISEPSIFRVIQKSTEAA